MHFYSYRYTSSQLTDIAKQVLCVSIVRSSVDPTKLSDATLRNIVQNTYSASTLEEQTKMYNQLYAARDADLQSRSMSAGPTPSIKAFVAMANNYTHPTMKLAVKAANEINGTNGTASPAPAYFRCTTAFSVTLQMNTAEKNVEPLKHWIEGYLYAGLGQYIENNGMTVVAQPDVRSNSNSVIVGSVTLLHTESSADLDQKIRKQLDAALKGAVSDKCPIPASSYTIEAALPFDGDGVNGTSDQDHQIKPEDEEDLPDEDFSDVEEIVKDLKSAPSTTSKKISVHGVSKFVQSGPVGWQRLQTGREYAWSPAIDCRCERNTEWTQFYLYPLFTNRHVPQLVHDIFQQFGSHMHLSMTQDPGSPGLYELDSIVLTVRAPADHNTVADRLGSPYGFYWHYKPEVQIPGTMDATKLSWAASFWINEGINNHNISDTFQRLRADPVAWQAYLDEWVLLENNLVKVLDRMFGQGGWHL
ncbi:MAG: hypothetical protein Q9202_002686 [Teloschistes flavicans]